MSHGQDLTVEIDTAWVVFRGRLADHVAAMADDDVLLVEYAHAAADEEGTSPYVQLWGFGDEWVRADAVLDAGVEEEAGTALLDLGWSAPDVDDESDGFHEVAERRDADRVAVLVVSTLREVLGVLHPAFLLADGLEHADGSPSPETPDQQADVVEDDVPDDAATFPHDSDHLQELVDQAMRVPFPDLVHDADGDIPVVAGQSMAFVRVLADSPGVEVYAEIAVDVEDLDRLPLELGLLNRSHPWWKFGQVDQRVVMRHEVIALPFSAHLLRTVLSRFVDEVDAIASDLVARVGGRRFRDLSPHEWAAVEADMAELGAHELDDHELAITGLLELCHLGRPRPATVAGLFDHDRSEIVRQIVAIRRGQRDCDGHDVEDVLTALREALRLLADVDPHPGALPPRPHQVAVDDDTLDLGWPA